jgi:hypothetical protein
LSNSSTSGAASGSDVLGDNPNDAGVDISSLLGQASKVWQAIK